MNIVLIGFKNCGKSTVGRALANKFHCPFLDTDKILLELYHTQHNVWLSIPEIHQQIGEMTFRMWEARVVENLSGTDNTIIATGGGVVLNTQNVDRLKQIGKIIYLKASPSELLKRQQATRIPSFLDQQKPIESFMQMYTLRSPLYERAADYSIDVDNKHAAEVVDKIMQQVF